MSPDNERRQQSRRQAPRRETDLEDWRLDKLEGQYEKLQTTVDQINGKMTIMGSMQTAHAELVRQVEACRADHLVGDRELWKGLKDHGAKAEKLDEKIADHATKLATVIQSERNTARIGWAILIAIIGHGVVIWLKG